MEIKAEKLFITLLGIFLSHVALAADGLKKAHIVEFILGTRVPHISNDADFCGVNSLNAKVISTEIEQRLAEIHKLTEVDAQYPQRVAQEILSVSSCFQLDPLIFTSLIGHESNFYHDSVSHTGAIGLGQLTSVSLREIAQQLQADHIDKENRGTPQALVYFEEAIQCIENDNEALTHWWGIPSRASRVKELKSNTLLNLTYAAIIYKISFSKTMSYFSKTSKTLSKNLNSAIESLLNYYNGASEVEQMSHYKKIRRKMNMFLELIGEQKNRCYVPAYN